MKSSRCWEMRNIMSELHEDMTWGWMKKWFAGQYYQKPVYFLCKKERGALLPSQRGSQPAAHTETQRPPAKPLAGLYSTILSASQSRQGAAGGEELCWIEEVDRLHGSGRSCLWLTEEPNSGFGRIDRLIMMSSHFGCQRLPASSTVVLQIIHRILRKSLHRGFYCLTFLHIKSYDVVKYQGLNHNITR